MSRIPATEGRGSAGSKVILIGEHAVVHGATALVLGLSKGVTAVARFADHPATLSIPRWQFHADVTGAADGDRALRALLGALHAEDRTMSIEAEADIPSRAGLGASASMAVAVTRAVSDLFSLPLSEPSLVHAVDSSERIFHASPSGIDSAAVRRAGLMTFSRKQGIHPLTIPAPPILVVHSGAPGATGETVKNFARTLAAAADSGAKRLARISELTSLAVDAISRRDYPALGQWMNENQEHLRAFGVSTERLDDICAVALKNGALGAKLTGGGGGGCAVILAPGREDAVSQSMTAAGYEVVISHV